MVDRQGVLDGCCDVGVLALDAWLHYAGVEEDAEERSADDPEQCAQWSIFTQAVLVKLGENE